MIIEDKLNLNTNKYSFMEIHSKKIYMINPQITNFKGILKAIDIMKPREFEYYIGKNSPMENSFRFNDYKMFRNSTVKYDKQKIKGAKEVNFILRGEKFHIVCLIRRKNLMEFLNIIYAYIFKERLCIGNESREKNYFSYLISKILSKNIYESIRTETEIIDGEVKKWKISF
ncbi:hypothetical protein [Clostridium felsineum]|uniref:Uncharacterized protein n=1 Tax=Clostridium felsineum TaxID=36839 RepID=A0A1S8LDD9_9CLOT|nr:hypothetical protein [Clostridium felsineum]URZ05913.1 hypothetical protein CLROS_012450 [Clostridium felsineum]URZ10950.1 hypothetical protein CROST_016660 [Clostridium felsineum]